MDGTGLKRRQTYEEVIEYIQNDPDKIIYPDRRAKFLRNSFELSFLDTHNYDDMIEQQQNMNAYHITENAIKEAAARNGTSALTERALAQSAAASSGSGVIRPVDPDASYMPGGVLSGFSGAVGSVVSDAVGTAAGAIGGLFRGVGSVFSGPSARAAVQPIAEDAGSAYLSLPDDTQTAEEALSSHAADMQHASDVESRRSESIKSQVSQHLQDVGAQHVLLPMSPSSSAISDTLPAPPTEYYQPGSSASSASSVNASSSNQPISIHSRPPLSVRSSSASPPVSIHASSASPPVSIHASSASPSASIHASSASPSATIHASSASPSATIHASSASPSVSIRSSPSVSIRSSPSVSIRSSPPASVHSVQRFSIASSPPISIHSNDSDYYTFDAIGQRHARGSSSSLR